MLKNYRNFVMAGVISLGLAACGDDLSIIEPPPPPEVPNITTFTVAPTSATIAPGTFVQASVTLITKPGVTGSVAWVSSNPAVATVDASGRIDALTEGTTVVTATATAGGETATAAIGVTVRPITPASISIQSITNANLGTPVNIGNVMGQIEINLNFDPGEEIVDSVAVFIGSEEAASQTFATSPSAGPITLSVNTANYVKNVAEGTTTVDFENGATTISAAVYPRGAQATATNSIQIVLNNADGWAADLDLPTRVATSAGGVSYWGGPGEDGLAEATVYPVIYTPGRTVESVTFRVGRIGFIGCTSNITMTDMPFRATFGYGADGADVDCGPTGDDYEWTGGPFTSRDNVILVAALDNASTPFAAPAPLIANTVVLGSTPDSARFDWDAPTVATPDIDRDAPAVTGWVNADFAFAATHSDAGVGVASSTGTDIFYNAPNCGGSVDNPVPSKTGADIPECGTNFIGGTPGLAGTAPYQVYAAGVDLLENGDVSPLSDNFGVDKTMPDIRWGLVDAVAPLDASLDDRVELSAKPAATDIWRAEYLDDRAGFYNMGDPDGFGIAAQVHSVSTAGHANNAGLCISGSAPIGATFVTAPMCGLDYITANTGFVRVDGWFTGETVELDTLGGAVGAEGYYGYRSLVVDAAGNESEELFLDGYINANAPFATGLGLPAQITGSAFPVQLTAADSIEVVNASLEVGYAMLPSATLVRYPQTSVGTIFDDIITSPLNTTLSPATGAPYARRIEAVTAAVFPNSNVGVAAATDAEKPNSVLGVSFGPANWSTNSPLIPIPALNVQDGNTIDEWNTANPTQEVIHWRLIPTLATTNQFGSTTPLRAQVVAPTNSPNAPFTRVDFYRLDAGGTWYNYLGSVAGSSAINTDQGTYRSWVFALPASAFLPLWDGTDQSAIVALQTVIAVGVTMDGDAIVAEVTF